MKTELKKKLIALGISTLLTSAIALLYILDPEDGSGKIASAILFSMWIFSVIPAYMFAYSWVKEKGFFEKFSSGFIFWGYGLVTIAIFIPLIIAPFLMIFFYFYKFQS